MSGRIRTIKPEILDDATTASLSNAAFRLFVSMILLADDHGNLRASPRYLAGQAFHSAELEQPIESVIEELVMPSNGSNPLIELYQVHNQLYAHIIGWSKHQRVDNAAHPRVPLPPGWVLRKEEEQGPGKQSRYKLIAEKADGETSTQPCVKTSHSHQETASHQLSNVPSVQSQQQPKLAPPPPNKAPTEKIDASRLNNEKTLENIQLTQFAEFRRESPRVSASLREPPKTSEIRGPDPRSPIPDQDHKNIPPPSPPHPPVKPGTPRVGQVTVEPPTAKPMGPVSAEQPKPMGQTQKPMGSPVQDGGGQRGRGYFLEYFKKLPHLSASDVDKLSSLAESRALFSASLDDISTCAIGQLAKEMATGRVRYAGGWLRAKLENLLKLDAKQFKELMDAHKSIEKLDGDAAILADVEQSQALFAKRSAERLEEQPKEKPVEVARAINESLKTKMLPRPDFSRRIAPLQPLTAPPETRPMEPSGDADEFNSLPPESNEWEHDGIVDHEEFEDCQEWQEIDSETNFEFTAKNTNSANSAISSLASAINPRLLKAKVA